MPRRKQRKPTPVPEEDRPSGSTSPELGYQGNVGCDSESTTVVKRLITPKKRGPRVRVPENDTDIIAYMEEKIANTFETAYTSICEAAGSKYSSDILLAAFNKIDEQNAASKPRLRSIFFEKFQFRLAFIVESLSSLENRLKVFRFAAKFSANLCKRGTSDFVDCLLEFCETLRYCEDAAVRQNICTLVGFLLKELGGCGGTENGVALDVRRKLYSILVERQLDKAVSVRAEVIKSVADIQDDEIPNDFVEALDRSPKDVILMGFRDFAAECRLTAVFALHAVIPAHCDYLIEIASSDPYSKVRAAAIRKLACVPVAHLTEQQRMDLLRGIIVDDEPSIMEVVCSVLIPEWISYISKEQRRKNMRRSGLNHVPDDDSAVIKSEVDSVDGDHHFAGLNRVKCDHGMGAAAQGLLAMLDYCDDPDAETIARETLYLVFDVVREKLRLADIGPTHFITSLVNDNTFPEVLSTHNYGNLLEEGLSRADRAQYVFFWRVLLKYCYDRASSEQERVDCVRMLCPALPEMCDLIARLQPSVSHADSGSQKVEPSVPFCDISQIALINLLEIIRLLERKDDWMDELKHLYLHLLRNKSLSKEVTDLVMVDLLDIFFEGKPDLFLTSVGDVTKEAILDAAASGMEDGSGGHRLTVGSQTSFGGRNEPDGGVMRYCMQLTHSMLRTGVFTSCSAVMGKVHEEIISVSFSSSNSLVRIWALEAAAILATLEDSLVDDVLSKAENALVDHNEEAKLSGINVVTDLIAVYGYQKVGNWQRGRQLGTNKAANFVDYLLETVKDRDSTPSLCLRACECAAKITLLEGLSSEEFPFADVIVALIFRLFQPGGSKLAEAKSCIRKFIAVFSAVQRKNQLHVVASFHKLMSQIRDDFEMGLPLKIEIDAALTTIVESTQFDILRCAPDRQEGPVQPVFLRELVNYQHEHPDDVCASLYWQTAASLDLEEFPLADLAEAQKTAQSIFENEDVSAALNSKAIPDLQKFMRCVEAALKSTASRAVEDAERGDCVTELRGKNGRTPGRGRRRTPKSTVSTPMRSLKATSTRRKATSTTKRSTQQVLDGNTTPSPPPVTNSLVTPVARDRPVLSRTAKNAAISRTRRWLFEQKD